MSRVTRSDAYRFWSLHTHSRYSINDALPGVADMVTKAVDLGYAALGLTDHGSVSGNFQLIKACRKAGIEPLPGIEMYVTDERELRRQGGNMHLTVAAYNETGYRNLVRLSTMAHQKFFFKPRLDLADLAWFAEHDYTEGLVVSTGCYFGLIPTTLRTTGPDATVRLLKTLDRWFPKVYVELQNHGIMHDDYSDDDLVEDLILLAERASLPYIITQDSHYLDQKDKPLHETLKELVAFSEDPSEAVFPGDGFGMVDNRWLRKYFDPEVLATGNANLAELAEAAHVRLPELEKFTLKLPDLSFGADPYIELVNRVMPRAKELGKRYRDRAFDELDVIERSGMAGYLLLVAEVCQFMRDKNIWFTARGSANNFLLCHLLNITVVDPVRWGLASERFTSADRIKPPDVDLDIEHVRRDEVGEWLGGQFAVRPITTFMTYSLKEDEDGENKGSLRVRYFAAQRKRGEYIDENNVPAVHWSRLKEISGLNLVMSYGKHPGGWLIAPDEPTAAELPLTYNTSSEQMMTSYDMSDVEDAGLIKLDVLGSREQTALRIACENAGVDPLKIPENDQATFKRISAGNTDGIFQLQGYTAKNGVMRLKPRRLSDIFICMALFRPALMKNKAVDDFLNRRRGLTPIPQLHEDIMTVTKETYGIVLYQEQVIDLLKRLGLSVEDRGSMLKAVKASNKNTAGAREKIEELVPRLRQFSEKRGWDGTDLQFLVAALEGYVDYGFNKGHAVAYGTVAYQQAYMATHHPLAFWLGQLVASQDLKKKAPKILTAARRNGIQVIGPHVNRSAVGYAVDTEARAIRRGLQSIGGVGPVAAEELVSKAPFTSLADLGQRCVPKKVGGAKALALHKHPDECGGVITALEEAGALRGLE